MIYTRFKQIARTWAKFFFGWDTKCLYGNWRIERIYKLNGIKKNLIDRLVTADGIVFPFWWWTQKFREQQDNQCERRSIDDASSSIHHRVSFSRYIVDSMPCHFPLSNNNDDEEHDTRSSKKQIPKVLSCSFILLAYSPSNLLVGLSRGPHLHTLYTHLRVNVMMKIPPNQRWRIEILPARMTDTRAATRWNY